MKKPSKEEKRQADEFVDLLTKSLSKELYATRFCDYSRRVEAEHNGVERQPTGGITLYQDFHGEWDEKTYPVLMKSKFHDLVVLFFSKTHGIVVKYGDPLSETYSVGYVGSKWNAATDRRTWSPYNSNVNGGIVVDNRMCRIITGKLQTEVWGLVNWPSGRSVDMKIHDDTSALSSQVAGTHYKDMAIQPIEFIHKNKLSYPQGLAIKYICRYKNKAGKEDLQKAIHTLELLMEMEYGNAADNAR
jgi:hypothetical protein